MPCDACHNTYVDMPCSKKKFKGLKYKAIWRYGKIKFFELRKDCPCINCLVKMACTKRTSCPDYMKLLDRIEIAHQNEGENI